MLRKSVGGGGGIGGDGGGGGGGKRIAIRNKEGNVIGWMIRLGGSGGGISEFVIHILMMQLAFEDQFGRALS